MQAQKPGAWFIKVEMEMEAHAEKGAISCASFHPCVDLKVFQQHPIVELAAAVINTTCDTFSPHKYSDQREGTPGKW